MPRQQAEISHRSEVRGQRSEVGGQRSEIRGRRSEVGGRQPAIAGGSIKPGVERKRNPRLISAKIMTARGAADSIKSRTPAELLGWGPRPGVERSGTPGTRYKKICKAREAADRRIIMIDVCNLNRFRPLRGLKCFLFVFDPGVSLRSTPGFMLSPAIAG